jgi:predicted lipoprotein with Yx(FWY)xxD motif
MTARGARAVSLGIAAAVVLVGCGTGAGSSDQAGESTPSAASSSAEPSPEPSATASAPPATPGQIVTTGDSEFGTMLFDDRGQAIYLFDQEPTSTPACYDDCAAAWPPVLTTGPPQAAGDVRAELLGTTTRSDGSVQVTYAGHPLYFYANEDPGEVLCHDVFLNGGMWYVVTPEGTPAP